MKSIDIAGTFEKYGPSVYRRARYLLGNHADAEEATQEVFIRALKSAEAFEHRAGVYTWLNRITTNYCLNQIRDRRRRQELWEEHKAELPQNFPKAPSADQLVLLRRLLAEAEEGCARAAVYVYLDGMNHKEAAKILGVSRRTVGNLIERFKQAAAEVAGGDCPDSPPRC